MRLKSLAAMAFLFAGIFVAFQAAASDTNPGKAAFEALRCQNCHSVQAQDILARGDQVKDDLSEVGKTRDQEWLKRYLQRDETLEDVTAHRVPFRGTDEQLESLTSWLAELGKE